MKNAKRSKKGGGVQYSNPWLCHLALIRPMRYHNTAAERAGQCLFSSPKSYLSYFWLPDLRPSFFKLRFVYFSALTLHWQGNRRQFISFVCAVPDYSMYPERHISSKNTFEIRKYTHIHTQSEKTIGTSWEISTWSHLWISTPLGQLDR